MLKGFNLSALFALVFGAVTTYEIDKAQVDAGGVASSPAIACGSDNGKPLYARVQVCTDRNFDAGAATSTAAIAGAIAQAAQEGAAVHADALTADPHA